MDRFPIFFQWLLPQVRWKSPTERILLTFDDGPHPESTPHLLELLDQMSISAIFFVLGERVEKYPDQLLAIQQKGHLIGNHGYNHRDPWLTSTASILHGIVQTEGLLNQFGIKSVGYRPAYGHWKPFWGYHKPFTTWLWSMDMKDYVPEKSIRAYHKRVNKLRKGDIVLLHDNPRFIRSTLNVLPILANHCIQRNLILSTT